MKNIFIAMITIFLLISCGGGGGDNSSENAPTASIETPKYIFDPNIDFEFLSTEDYLIQASSSKSVATVGSPITFSVKNQSDTDVISSATWTFDDEEIAGETITKSFAEPGVYSVAIDVENEAGGQAADYLIVNIIESSKSTIPEFAGLRIGDINDDNIIDATDIQLLSNHLDDIDILSSSEFNAADIDLDEQLTSNDLELLMQAVDAGWPTYISATSTFPARTLNIMLPELLSNETDISVKTEEYGDIQVERVIPGYASFVVPISEKSFETGEFYSSSVDFKVYDEETLLHTFTVEILPPQNVVKDTGKRFLENLETIDDELSNFETSLDEMLDEITATSEERAAATELFETASDYILQAQEDFIKIFKSMNPDTLNFILQVASEESDLSKMNSAFSDQVSSRSIASKSSESMSGGCAISSEINDLLINAELSNFNTQRIQPLTKRLSMACDVISAAAYFFPKLIVVSGNCSLLSNAMDLGQILLETLSEATPKIKRDLIVTVDNGHLLDDEIAQSRIFLEPDTRATCATGLSSKLSDIAVKKITKKYRLNKAMKILTSMPLIDRRESRDFVLNHINSLVKNMGNLISVAFEVPISNLREKFCGLGFDNNKKYEVPACYTDTFEAFSTSAEPHTYGGFVDKNQGTYIGAPSETCKIETIMIETTLESAKGSYRGFGNVAITQECSNTCSFVWNDGSDYMAMNSARNRCEHIRHQNGKLFSISPLSNTPFPGFDNLKEKYPNKIFPNDYYKHGIDTYYYENGKIKEEIPFKYGVVTGVKKEYSKEGYLLMETSFSNEILHGVSKEYYPTSDRIIRRETPFVDGTVNGTEIVYYESGSIYFERPYVDGVINGTEISYYESGNKKTERPHIDGVLEGTGTFFREDGSKLQEMLFVNGIPHGTATEYLEDGYIMETPWVNGVIHGTEIIYRDDGTVYSTRIYVDGSSEPITIYQRGDAPVIPR